MITLVKFSSCVVTQNFCFFNIFVLLFILLSCNGELLDKTTSFSSKQKIDNARLCGTLKEKFVSSLLEPEFCAKIIAVTTELAIDANVNFMFLNNTSKFESEESAPQKTVIGYSCLKNSITPLRMSDKVFLRSDSEDSTKHKPFLDLEIAMPIILLCFTLSSLMSGLNIGLMALDPTELKLLKISGTEKEKKYAGKILTVRRHGNFLLCSILLTCTLCNSISTVLIDDFVTSWIAVLITTLTIMLLCEILPQAICNYFPLLIGYYTIYVTMACMIITAPISYPLGKLLNLILGTEIVAPYTKERLKELLKMTELPKNEEKIISGALELGKKRVEDVMTPLNDVFKLPITAVMDFETIAAILDSGYSRIPIYDGDSSNIVSVLLTKDLALLDPDDKVPVNMLVQHSNYQFTYIPAGTTLDQVFNVFKESRGHMAFVAKDKITDFEVTKNHIIGVITFEDVIEEILQEEINDETDTFLDNKSKRRLSNPTKSKDLYLLLSKYSTRTTAPSENLKLAIFHFLSGIDMFSSKHISPRVLLNVLSLDIYYSAGGRKLPEDSIYVQGVPVDFFVMVVEGEVQVRIGNEDLKFNAGAFKYFGVDALKKGQEKYEPDYSLQALKKTLYLKISKTLYHAAVLATSYEKHGTFPDVNVKSELFKYFKLLVEADSAGSLSPKD